MIAWLLSPLGRGFTAGLVILLLMGWLYQQGRRDGAAAVRAEIAAENARRLNDATRADDASRKCAADPVCRLSNDGFRRD